MQIFLKQIRKAGDYTQQQVADGVGVKVATYRTWENGKRMPSFAQVIACAEFLGCTTDEIAGRPIDHECLKPYERELIECYRSSTPERQDRLLDSARDSAAMSKEAAKRSELSSAQVSA